MAFGEAPDSMEALNRIGLALISRNRNQSHMFSHYAGQHKNIRGFHTMYQNNLNHTQETLLRMNDRQSPNVMSVVLQGPFTQQQKTKVLESMTVDRNHVLACFDFLRANNSRYMDLPIIEEGDYFYPEPIVLDSSVEEEDTNDPVEQIFESTVYFPDSTEVTPETGGMGNSQAFTLEYMRTHLNGTSDSTMTSRPTTEYANDRNEFFLVDSFPLQFPYGKGGPKDERPTSITSVECYQYYLRVANRNFMRSDFILVLHSLYEKQKAMTSASIRMAAKDDDVALASRLAVLNPDKLAEEAKRRLDARKTGYGAHDATPEKLFFDTLEISCKAMAHTNHASKAARRRLFSMWYSICSPGVFFTISPCDETNFRMRLYIGREEVCFLFLYIGHMFIALFAYIFYFY
jgi:hypothetical protein